jgi:hypothetical protein
LSRNITRCVLNHGTAVAGVGTGCRSRRWMSSARTAAAVATVFPPVRRVERQPCVPRRDGHERTHDNAVSCGCRASVRVSSSSSSQRVFHIAYVTRAGVSQFATRRHRRRRRCRRRLSENGSWFYFYLFISFLF